MYAHRMMVDGKGATAAEWATLSHTRGWCHDGAVCAICVVERRAYDAEQQLESVISG
jgi:hypothetical protein